MFFGAKKRKVATKPKKSLGTVVVGGKTKKLHKGKKGGLFYKTRSGKTYVDAKFIRAHSPKKSRKSPKKVKKSPKKAKKSPVKAKKSRRSPKRTMRRSRWGYGLGQPSLTSMMGPASLRSPQFVYPSAM